MYHYYISLFFVLLYTGIGVGMDTEDAIHNQENYIFPSLCYVHKYHITIYPESDHPRVRPVKSLFYNAEKKRSLFFIYSIAVKKSEWLKNPGYAFHMLYMQDIANAQKKDKNQLTLGVDYRHCLMHEKDNTLCGQTLRQFACFINNKQALLYIGPWYTYEYMKKKIEESKYESTPTGELELYSIYEVWQRVGIQQVCSEYVATDFYEERLLGMCPSLKQYGLIDARNIWYHTPSCYPTFTFPSDPSKTYKLQ